MHRTLVIGAGSQISHYLRESLSERGKNYLVITSRSFDDNLSILKEEWNDVYLAFGESRKSGINHDEYNLVNYDLTKKYIDILRFTSKKIVCFSTCELWGNYTGPVDTGLIWDYKRNPYTDSKKKISEYILGLNLNHIMISYPFNFNSPLRTNDFLFGKIFKSIIEKKRIELGSTNFKRDIVHPRFLTHRILEMKNHEVIGSGRLTNVRNFIDDIYRRFGMNSQEWITETITQNSHEKITEYYANTVKTQSYESLLDETIQDLKNYRSQKWDKF